MERGGDCRLRGDQLRDERSDSGDPRLSPNPNLNRHRPQSRTTRETKIMKTLTTLFQCSAVAIALYVGAMFLMAGQTVTLFG